MVRAVLTQIRGAENCSLTGFNSIHPSCFYLREKNRRHPLSRENVASLKRKNAHGLCLLCLRYRQKKLSLAASAVGLDFSLVS